MAHIWLGALALVIGFSPTLTPFQPFAQKPFFPH